jgi:hypothetical protein
VLTNERSDDRISLIPAFSKGKQLGFGPATQLVILQPSSGEESEDELAIQSSDPIT